MRKTEIDSILLVNWYFTNCKLAKPSCPKTEMVRKYLLKKVSKALVNREKPNGVTHLLSKAFVVLILLLVTNF
jgi:hypothetical protein